ncbi:MAG TPA: hypothetical protein VF573_11350 [Paraburkholderia sp.]|uniref:hypothetical protein n=1 Tax=Paraburkholderia sp. TaxID=1926495 RepID=UPI002ED078FB
MTRCNTRDVPFILHTPTPEIDPNVPDVDPDPPPVPDDEPGGPPSQAPEGDPPDSPPPMRAARPFLCSARN